MGKKLSDKTAANVGKEENCPSCNEKVVLGVKKAEGYPDKFQWMGKDGNAHYNWNGQSVTCVILDPKGGSGDDTPPEQGTTDPPPQEGTTTAPGAVTKQDGTVHKETIISADWWERNWPTAKRIANNLPVFTDNYNPPEKQHQIQAMAIMHDFATLEFVQVLKKALK